MYVIFYEYFFKFSGKTWSIKTALLETFAFLYLNFYSMRNKL